MNKYLLTFLKVLINFGLMMKDEWLTLYSRFLATETVHILQVKSNSTAEKNLIVQISLTFWYEIRFWWFKYHWKDLNKIYTIGNPSLEF